VAVASPVSVEVEELFCSVVVELSLGVVDEEASAGVESEANTQSAAPNYVSVLCTGVISMIPMMPADFSNKLALGDRSCSSSVGMLSNDLDNLVRCFVILKNSKHLLRRLG